jgi:hypothetical protein
MICDSPPTRRECNDANVVSRRGSGCSEVATERDFVKIWDISMHARIMRCLKYVKRHVTRIDMEGAGRPLRAFVR